LSLNLNSSTILAADSSLNKTSHLKEFIFIVKGIKGKGKMFPLQARCGPKGG